MDVTLPPNRVLPLTPRLARPLIAPPLPRLPLTVRLWLAPTRVDEVVMVVPDNKASAPSVSAAWYCCVLVLVNVPPDKVTLVPVTVIRPALLTPLSA